MSSENPKQALFAQFAVVAKALGNANRLELLEFVAQGESSVEVLAGRAGLSIANTSQHLNHLRRAGLATSRRDGKRVFNRLADDSVIHLLTILRGIAERNLGEVQRIVNGYFHDRDALAPVSREELITRLRDDEVTLLDVRSEDEYLSGHLPGAVNIPIRELEHKFADLSRDREIIAYCRGPYCVLSFEAVAALRARGYRVRRLEDGFPEWKVAGLPVETDALPDETLLGG